jgi:opacity protein-like surface antigen
MAQARRVQDYPTAEVSGGFSYLRVEGGENLYGWDASVMGNLNRWLGLGGEFSGHYGSGDGDFFLPGTFGVSSSSSVYTFLFGPRFSYREHKKLKPFAHVLPGFARSAFSVTVNTPSTSVRTSASTTGFAMALGGGLDIKLSDDLAFRMIQMDYLLTHFSSATQNNLRITTGLVLSF